MSVCAPAPGSPRTPQRARAARLEHAIASNDPTPDLHRAQDGMGALALNRRVPAMNNHGICTEGMSVTAPGIANLAGMGSLGALQEQLQMAKVFHGLPWHPGPQAPRHVALLLPDGATKLVPWKKTRRGTRGGRKHRKQSAGEGTDLDDVAPRSSAEGAWRGGAERAPGDWPKSGTCPLCSGLAPTSSDPHSLASRRTAEFPSASLPGFAPSHDGEAGSLGNRSPLPLHPGAPVLWQSRNGIALGGVAAGGSSGVNWGFGAAPLVEGRYPPLPRGLGKEPSSSSHRSHPGKLLTPAGDAYSDGRGTDPSLPDRLGEELAGMALADELGRPVVPVPRPLGQHSVPGHPDGSPSGDAHFPAGHDAE